MAAAVLATEGEASATATILLTMLNQNNSTHRISTKMNVIILKLCRQQFINVALQTCKVIIYVYIYQSGYWQIT